MNRSHAHKDTAPPPDRGEAPAEEDAPVDTEPRTLEAPEHTERLPFVSIIVPVYNGERVLPACIESLLAQTYPDDRYEIIIVDNGSTDRTRAVIEQYSVRYVPEFDQQSSYAARNTGIMAARGSILAFTDADCIADRVWLSNAVPAFSDAPDVGCVAGGIEGSAPETWVEEQLTNRGWLSQEVTLNHNFLPYPQTANALYRRSVFDRAGLFESTWPSAGDADLAWRMQMDLSLDIQYVPEARVEHRHRTDLPALYRQCVKWGYGNMTLEKKYGAPLRSLTPPLWRTSLSIVKQGIRVGAHLLAARTRGPLSDEDRGLLIRFVRRTGIHVGKLRAYAQLSTSKLAGW